MYLSVPLTRSKRHTIKLSSFRVEETVVFYTVFSEDGGLIVTDAVEAQRTNNFAWRREFLFPFFNIFMENRRLRTDL